MRTLPRAVTALALWPCFGSPAFAQVEVHTVQASPGVSPSLALFSAIDTADDGDVLLLLDPVYAGLDTNACSPSDPVQGFLIDDKSLTLIGAVPGGAKPVIHDKLFIEHLSAERTVVLRGIDVVSQDISHPSALRINANDGRIFIEDCSFTAGQYLTPCGSATATVDIVAGTGSVAFTRCSMVGAPARNDDNSPALEGLAVNGTGDVALYDCQVTGGSGEGTPFLPAIKVGARGMVVAASRVFASGTTIRGGQSSPFAGDGGAAVQLLDGGPGGAPGILEVLDCFLQGGLPLGPQLDPDSDGQIETLIGRAHSCEIPEALVVDTLADSMNPTPTSFTTDYVGAYDQEGFGLLMSGGVVHNYLHDEYTYPDAGLLAAVGVTVGAGNFPQQPYFLAEVGIVSGQPFTGFVATTVTEFTSPLTGIDPNSGLFNEARQLFVQPAFYDGELTQHPVEFYNMGSPSVVVLLHPTVAP